MPVDAPVAALLCSIFVAPLGIQGFVIDPANPDYGGLGVHQRRISIAIVALLVLSVALGVALFRTRRCVDCAITTLPGCGHCTALKETNKDLLDQLKCNIIDCSESDDPRCKTVRGNPTTFNGDEPIIVGNAADWAQRMVAAESVLPYGTTVAFLISHAAMWLCCLVSFVFAIILVVRKK